MSYVREILAVAAFLALGWAVARVAEGQPPIRIGATLAQTGADATSGGARLPGYQLCVKHMNDKGGVLGRKLELIVYDDRSDPATAARLYEQLITQDKVDLVLGPNGSPITDAVAGVTEKHKMPMVAPAAGATSIYRKGRRFLFSMISPAEFYLEGLIDLAAKKGLRTVALINVDDVAGREVAQGTIELAKRKGLQVVSVDTYPQGTTDFSPILTKIRAANPDVLGVATQVLGDGAAMTRQMKALDVNPRMVGFVPAVSLPRLHEVLGRDAEFAYSATSWRPELVEVRAGGLIPIARQYPGAREFVESFRKEFPGQVPHPAAYSACQILIEAVRRAGSLDGQKLRDVISKMDHNTVYGRFRVDRDGVQIGHKMLLVQWQDGRA